MNNILICTDCSENARKASEQCFSLFQDDPKHYFLLNSYTVPYENYADIIRLNDDLKRGVENCLRIEKERLEELQHANIASLTTHNIFGRTENVVNRLVARKDIDLVVLGNQGENFQTDKLFGSTSEKIIFEVPCPKLIVPKLDNYKTNSTQLVIAEEKQIQNKKWWSNLSLLAANKNYTIQLVVIPSNQGKLETNSPSIPTYIAKDTKDIHFFYGKSMSEMNYNLNKLIEKEQPSLLNINFSNEKLARQIIQPSNQKDCICNKVPFIVQPFHEAYSA